MQIQELARLGTSPLLTTGWGGKLPAKMNWKTFMLFLILTFHVQVMLITDFSFPITVLDELYDFRAGGRTSKKYNKQAGLLRT